MGEGGVGETSYLTILLQHITVLTGLSNAWLRLKTIRHIGGEPKIYILDEVFGCIWYSIVNTKVTLPKFKNRHGNIQI